MNMLTKVAIIVSLMPVFGNMAASIECHNPHHNHNHSANCHHHYDNGHCHNHYHEHRPHAGFSLNLFAPVEPVRFVERTYCAPATRVVKTYSRPAYETTTYKTYGSPYGVTQTQTVYTAPVYETVTVASPVVYETVEYRAQHPVSAAFNFAGAMIDAFAN